MSLSIDPEILAARAEQARLFPAFDVTRLSSAEGRRLANAAASVFNDGQPEMARITDSSLDGPGGTLRMRLYDPPGRRGAGGILYLHGGGWFACDVDTHDRMLRALALESGTAVIGVDYRLSPEHPFPAAFEDCLAAWCWLQDAASGFDIDPRRIALTCDSAGANLALALCIHLRNAALPMPAGAALLYGCFAPGLETESARRFGQGGYGLTAERMAWYWDNYLGPAKADPPVLATPLHAELGGLPPVFLGIAEADTVADESRLLHDRLVAAGIDAQLCVWPNTVHGFLQMTRDVAAARAAVADTARALTKWTR